MKVLKKIWLYSCGPALMFWVSLYMITLLLALLLKVNDLGALVLSIFFLLGEIILCGGVISAYVYSIVVAAKKSDVAPLILTIFLSCFYFPFYHRKLDNDSLAFPIISVVATALGYVTMLISYLLLMICAVTMS